MALVNAVIDVRVPLHFENMLSGCTTGRLSAPYS
jgi:hypothetical protein